MNFPNRRKREERCVFSRIPFFVFGSRRKVELVPDVLISRSQIIELKPSEVVSKFELTHKYLSSLLPQRALRVMSTECGPHVIKVGTLLLCRDRVGASKSSASRVDCEGRGTREIHQR
jgi:hypothetical protein